MSMQHASAAISAAGVAPVQLENTTALAYAVSPATATAEFRLNTSGDAETRLNLGSWSSPFSWLLAGSASDFECRMTMNSGTNFSGSALGTWLSLGTTRTWSHERSGTNGITTGTATLEIRRASTSTVLATATVTIAAERGL